MKLITSIGWFWFLVPLIMLTITIHATIQRLRFSRNARISQELLVTILDSLDEGLEIWDPNDRLLHFNLQINRLHIDYRSAQDIGKSFTELTRAQLAHQKILAAIDHEEEWLKKRLESRERPSAPQLNEYAGDRWFRTQERRTRHGYLIASWVDVTDLVRSERSLKTRNAMLQRQSDLDSLTGLCSRGHFDDILAAELSRAERNGLPISLLMIDIDHFKLYNDCYGHVSGDACLKTVAIVLARCVRRAGELVARYGGEEFVVLLPGSGLEHAIEVAQNSQEQLRLQAIQHKRSASSHLVTLSIGIAAATPMVELRSNTMLNAADSAMYRAKTAGRNGYKVAGDYDWHIQIETPRTGPAELGSR